MLQFFAKVFRHCYDIQDVKKVMLFLTLSGVLFATPEKYDHLSPYKSIKSTAKGPKSELVYNASNKLVAKATYEYNKSNQLVRIHYYRNNQKDGYTDLTYRKKRLLEEKTFAKSGKLDEYLKYNYRGGKITGFEVNDVTKKDRVVWKFNYQDETIRDGSRYFGNQITERFNTVSQKTQPRTKTIYNAEGEMVSVINFVYEGDLLKARIIQANTGLKKVKYIHDQNGRVIEIKFFRKKNQGYILVKKHKLNYSTLNAKSGISKI